MNKPERQGAGFPLKLDQINTPTPKRLASDVRGSGAAETRGGSPASKSARAKAVNELLSGPIDPAMVRARMVERLRAGGIKDEVVLAAMARVPRHVFVDSALMVQAYEDTSLPIGLSQTISKPSVVARMVELLRQPHGGAGPMGKVLEIGTGCGYQAAVLAEMSRQVFSVERLRTLHDKARHNLQELRRDNLRLILGDGILGHPPNAPYDAIIVAASGESVPQAWLDQLAPGGRLVAPTQHGPKGQQVLMVIDRRTDGTLTRSIHESVRFVPLKSGVL